MRPPIEFLFPPELGTELIYSFVIILCSLMIYYSTKEMYELSSYKGIKYFRLSFLFFAIAYFFRYFIMFILGFLNIDQLFSPKLAYSLSMIVFLYSSCMAIFFLLHSVMWKKWGDNKLLFNLFNFIAIIISAVAISFRRIEIPLMVNILFFVFVSVILFVAYNDSKNKQKGKNLIAIYLMLFVFFFLNIVETLIPKFLQMYKLGVYIISIFIFMLILYKVIKKIGN